MNVVNHSFGPRTNRVYAALREQILGGAWEPGSKLPSYLELAAEFGVAPMTVRQVLGRLEAEGLVQRQLGRGTFVREPVRPGVLIVGGDPSARVLLCERVEQAGYQATLAGGPDKALALLEGEAGIALVLAAARLPTTSEGTAFIRAVRRRWPELPLAAVTSRADDLAELHGSAECPVMILPKPLRASQVDEVLGLALAKSRAS